MESKLTVVDNSNKTMIVKMNGAKHRKIKARGKYKFRRKYFFGYTVVFLYCTSPFNFRVILVLLRTH